MAPRRICAGEATVSCKSMMTVRGSVGFADLPFFRGSITPEPTSAGNRNNPAHPHRCCSLGLSGYFNRHTKRTGECRFVRGVPVGNAARTPMPAALRRNG